MQDDKWLVRYNDDKGFIERNKRNPSRYDAEERGRYCNWLKHNRKLYAAGKLKEEREEMFRRLLELSEEYRRRNQYE